MCPRPSRMRRGHTPQGGLQPQRQPASVTPALPFTFCLLPVTRWSRHDGDRAASLASQERQSYVMDKDPARQRIEAPQPMLMDQRLDRVTADGPCARSFMDSPELPASEEKFQIVKAAGRYGLGRRQLLAARWWCH